MKVDKETVISTGIKWLTIKEYLDNYTPGLSSMAISIAMNRGDIDYMQPSRDRFILITERTLKFVPRTHKNRDM
jgi:hypothetical protein